jgi:thioredoxin 1
MVKVIDFWAEWCGPCKVMSPRIENLTAEYSDNADVTIEKINVDAEENMTIAREAKVQSIPTLIFYKNGVEENRMVGLKSEADIKEAIEALLN